MPFRDGIRRPLPDIPPRTFPCMDAPDIFLHEHFPRTISPDITYFSCCLPECVSHSTGWHTGAEEQRLLGSSWASRVSSIESTQVSVVLRKCAPLLNYIAKNSFTNTTIHLSMLDIQLLSFYLGKSSFTDPLNSDMHWLGLGLLLFWA